MGFHSIVILFIYSERGDRDLKGLLLFFSNTVPTAVYVTENSPKIAFWDVFGRSFGIALKIELYCKM